MSRWVCKLCIIQKGLKGSDLEQWPEAPDDAWIAEHLRTAHGVEMDHGTPRDIELLLEKMRRPDLPFDENGRWVPFEERPRPDADLAGCRLSNAHGIEITILHPDEAALGRIFAWLLGQVMAARTAAHPMTRKDWGFE